MVGRHDLHIPVSRSNLPSGPISATPMSPLVISSINSTEFRKYSPPCVPDSFCAPSEMGIVPEPFNISGMKLRQGNIFTPVSQSFCSQRGGGVDGGGHVWQGGMHGGAHAWQGGMCDRGCAWREGIRGRGGGMHGRGACVAGGHAWHACPPTRYYEIRSMSWQDASYWNAYLSSLV